MSFYGIKNKEGKWLTFGEDAKIRWDIDCWAFKDRQMADYYAEENGGEIVPLVEKPAPVVVSEAEEYLLKELSNGGYLASDEISYFTENHSDEEPDQIALQDRLMRAYVIGWVVEKPKRYMVLMKIPGKTKPAKEAFNYLRAGKYDLDPDHIGWNFSDADGTTRTGSDYTFTLAEIEHYGLQDCEKVEVTDDEQ